MSINKANEISAALASRYGVHGFDCNGWSELKLEGGVAMSARDFSALAKVAKCYGDHGATVYEIESLENDLAPIELSLDYDSFRRLKGAALSHFESALVPSSKRWVALLTVDLETLIFADDKFLREVAAERQLREMPVNRDQ